METASGFADHGARSIVADNEAHVNRPHDVAGRRDDADRATLAHVLPSLDHLHGVLDVNLAVELSDHVVTRRVR